MATVGEIEEQIRHIEGFNVRFLSPEGRDVRGDMAGLPAWQYERAADGGITVSLWIARRIEPIYPGFRIEVMDGVGAPVYGNKRLHTLRNSYRSVADEEPAATPVKGTVQQDERPDETAQEAEIPEPDRMTLQWPATVLNSKEPVPSVEIDVDYLPEPYSDGRWVELVMAITLKWIAENRFSGAATLWEFGTLSADFHHSMPSRAVFIASHGFPGRFCTHLGRELGYTLGQAVRFAESVLTRSSDGWDSFCHVEQNCVWQPVDAAEWIEFREM